MEQKMIDALNEQMNFEYYSAHIYLSMAAYAGELGLAGFEHWLMTQYEEEVFHAQKFYHYIVSRNGRAVVKGFEDPEKDFDSLVSMLETALDHERIVTGRINDLVKLADQLDDYATHNFLQWYVGEQVEEEETFTDLIQKVKLVKDAGLYMLDKELQSRTFTPPAQED
jgi:ferritin